MRVLHFKLWWIKIFNLLYKTFTNRRPIPFKEFQWESKLIKAPNLITPEHLIHGFTVNLLPDLFVENSDDSDWQANNSKSIQTSYSKLAKVRNQLLDIYQNEFITTLIAQAKREKIDINLLHTKW